MKLDRNVDLFQEGAFISVDSEVSSGVVPGYVV